MRACELDRSDRQGNDLPMEYQAMPSTQTTFLDEIKEFLAESATFVINNKPFLPTSVRLVPERNGRQVALSFGLVDLSSPSEGKPINPRFIRPLAFGPRKDLSLGTEDVSDSDAGTNVVYLDSDPEELAEDLVIQRGETRYRFIFDLRSRATFRGEFKNYLQNILAVQADAQAEELSRIKAVLRAVAEPTSEAEFGSSEDLAEIRVKERKIVQEFVTAANGYEATARRWLVAYYCGGMLPFLCVLCLEARLTGFHVFGNHLTYVGISAALYLLLIEIMKRTLAFAQRQHSIGRFHLVTASRFIVAPDAGRKQSLKLLDTKKRESEQIIKLAAESCQQPTTLLKASPETVDMALSYVCHAGT